MAGEPIIQTSGLGSTFNALRNRDPQRLERQKVPIHRDYKEIPRQNFAPTSSVHGAFGGHMTRQASAVAGGGIVYGQPQFFSPVHTPINWQIPSKRIEIYQWCFVEDTPVLMSNGLNKCIQDIEINEHVISHKGEIKRVIDKGKRIVEEDIVYLNVAGLKNTLKTTVNHEICVIKKRKIQEYFKTLDPYPYKYLEDASKEDLDSMLEWVPSVAIEKGDYVLTPILNIESGFDFCSQYSTCDSESEINIFKDLMFVLGLYVAEGCFSWYRYKKVKRPKGLRFCINKDESEIIERLKSSVKNICGKDLNVYNNGDGNSYDIHVNDKGLALFVHGLVFGTAKHKNIDEAVLYAPSEGLIEFLTGYISGDGHINCSNSYIDCVTASEALVENLSFIFMRLNIPFRIYPYTSKCKRYNGFHLVVDATECKKIGIKKLGYEFGNYEAISKSVIPTKLGLMRLINKVDFHYYSGFVYNIEVEDHKSYVANFIGVHNSRFFYENEPKVASAMDFYSYFPMNDYEHECKDRKIKKHFDKLKKRLGLAKWCRLMSHEIHLLGDCFPFIEISCESCGGQGHIGEEVCEHEGGTVRRVVILNPDYVEVYTSPMNPDPVVAMRPDEELINMVQKKTPGYEKLAPAVRALVSSGRPIRLDNRNVSHLKYGESGYSPYGVGMVRRLFPILSYKTKLMVAQWIVAERLIVPIKIVKVGTEDRPAGPADIAAVQSQLAQTANDPNLTIVTHHAFDLEWYGACMDKETEVLTENGWKKYADVSKCYDEKIATYNKDNDCLEYQIPQNYHEYDYDGDLCTFKGRHLDIAVTPNHKMLASMRKWDSNSEKYIHLEWGDVRADNVIENSRFKCVTDWQGEIPNILPYKSDDDLMSDLSLDDYLEFIGYYLSEGGLKIDKGVVNSVGISQKEDSPSFESIRNSVLKVSSKVQELEDNRSDPPCWTFNINNCKFARMLEEKYGRNSSTKKIPSWILGLPKRELTILLNALMAGDGNTRFTGNGKPRYKYTTTSKYLADSVQEIVLKMGYSPKCHKTTLDNPRRNDIYNIFWCESTKEQKYVTVKERNIGRMRYKDKVWCFTVGNGYFITRRNGKITIQGNSGKVLTLSNEFDFINQEVLDGMMINNALLNGEGPNFCLSACSRVLCDSGLKYKDEVDIEKDLIATFNKETGAIEYQRAIRKYEYDYNSIDGDDLPLKHFKTNRIDMLVTPNHKMLWAKRKLTTGKNGQKIDGQTEGFGEWKVSEAAEVKVRGKFRACVDKWVETTKDNGKYCGIPTEDFLKILGWYISEGCKHFNTKRNLVNGINIGQSESGNNKTYNAMKTVFSSVGVDFSETARRDTFFIGSRRNALNEKLVNYLSALDNCGDKANSKCIPRDIKNMSCKNLKILLDALVEGDGSVRPATKKKPTTKKYYSYTTVSRQLRDDVIEILFKLGYSPRFNTIKFDSDKLQTQYTINWSDTDNGKFPVLDSRKWNGEDQPQSKKQVIFDEDYVGKVWCVEVPNHFIITERNGLFGIHGNSNAAVGIEAMIERLETFRREMARWIEEKIYLPEAIRQGFIDEDEEGEEIEYIYPRVKWNSMHLRDQQQYRTFLLQLYEKGLLSAQTVLEAFDLDPDQEIERKRYDAVHMLASQQGQQGMGGDMGGGFGGGGGGGMPSLGGGDMGAPGGMGGGGMGAPGEAAGAPMGPAGGMAGAGGAPPMAASTQSSITTESAAADPGQYGGKILKKKTREKINSDRESIYKKQQQQQQQSKGKDPMGQMRDPKGRIVYTKNEMRLMDGLNQNIENGLIKYPIIPQFPVKFGSKQYSIDFAIPNLKIGLEADGEAFHGSAKQITHDAERDQCLNQMGWTIMRFTDEEIENKLPEVMRTIVRNIMDKELSLKQQLSAPPQG